LNLAACGGINRSEPSPWFSGQRYEGKRYGDSQQLAKEDEEFYNGLDYMLLHNLYRLNYAGGTFPNGNQMNNYVTASIGTPNSMRIGYNSVQTANTVNISGNNSAFVSQNQIVLNPGFSTNGTTKFEARIDPNLGCNTGSNTSNARLAQTESKKIDTLVKAQKIKRAFAMTDSLLKVVKANGYKPLTQYLAERKQEVENEKLDLNQPNVSVVPNPATKHAQLVVELKKASTIHIVIVNALGTEIDVTSIIEESILSSGYEAGTIKLNMDLKSLTNGIYFLKLFTNKSEKTTKLIIQ
jgi:hypothetical protein